MLEKLQPVEVEKEEKQMKAELHHALSHVATQLVPVVYLGRIIKTNVTGWFRHISERTQHQQVLRKHTNSTH